MDTWNKPNKFRKNPSGEPDYFALRDLTRIKRKNIGIYIFRIWNERNFPGQDETKKVEGSIGKDVICWTLPVPRPQERRRDVIKSIKATVTGRKSDCLPHMLTCHVSSSNGRAACREWDPSAASSQGTARSGDTRARSKRSLGEITN